MLFCFGTRLLDVFTFFAQKIFFFTLCTLEAIFCVVLTHFAVFHQCDQHLGRISILFPLNTLSSFFVSLGTQSGSCCPFISDGVQE